MTTSIKDIILYYQKKIDRNIHDEKVVVDSIYKIAKLPVTVEILRDTGIYNVMRMLSLKAGAVGAKALSTFKKWRHLMNFALKDKDSPIKTPDQPRSDERPRSTPVLTSNHASRSSAESNASRSSRDNASRSSRDSASRSSRDSASHSSRDSASLSSRDNNASHSSRDNNSGRSMKYSDPSQFGRRDQYDLDRDARCSGGSYADFNGMGSRDARGQGSSSSDFNNGIGNSNRMSEGPSADARGSSSDANGLGNRDSYHLYEDGSYNPHLSIDNSDKLAGSGSDEASDQNGGTKGKILEPYAIEMREGMFRVVKCKDTSAIPPSILRTRQLYYKDFLQKTVPYKKEREGPPPKHKESPVKRERSPSKGSSHHSNGERPSKIRKVESSANGSVERHPCSTLDKSSRPKAGSEAKNSTFATKIDGASPSSGGESKGSDRKRAEKKSTPDSVPDKSKLKAAKEERSSHVVST